MIVQQISWCEVAHLCCLFPLAPDELDLERDFDDMCFDFSNLVVSFLEWHRLDLLIKHVTFSFSTDTNWTCEI